MYTHVDGPQVIPNVHLAVCLLIPRKVLGLSVSDPTDLNNSYRARHRLRTYDWLLHTCTLMVIHIKLPVTCLSCERSFPPLTSGSVPNLD